MDGNPVPLLEECSKLCSSSDWDAAQKQLSNISKDESSMRKAPPAAFLQLCNKSLKSIADGITAKDASKLKSVCSCATECFRCLRQACALNTELQGSLTHACPDLLTNTRKILEAVITHDPKQDNENVLKCAAQFLGNACVANSENQKIVWSTFLQQIRSMVQHPDNKVCDYTCMLVHTCLAAVISTDPTLLNNEAAQDVVLGCIQGTAQNDVEWGLYVLEDMLKNDLFLVKLYGRMGLKERLLLLEVILAEMNELPALSQKPQTGYKDQQLQQDGSRETSTTDNGAGGAEESKDRASACQSKQQQQLAVSPGNLAFIAEEAKRECNLLLEIDKSEATGQEDCMGEEQSIMEALVIAKELEALSIAAQHMDLYPGIQQDSELLKCSINLLRSITEKGKSGGDSVFKREEKASAQDSVDPHHPVFGLKKDLIRLIANMAYRHRQNQDLVRTNDGIPLLLDLTMMDTRNPFITQWVVLAIRNLVEGNRDNRNVLSGMSLQGMAGHMAQLREVGVHTELRKGKIVVKPAE